MKLGVHGWRLTGPATGVRRYLYNVVRHWDPDRVAGRFDRITVYLPSPLPDDLRLPEGMRTRVIGPALRMLPWENLRLGPVADDDVLFCPSFSRPLVTRGRTVVTMHEAAHFHAPGMFGRRSGLYNRLYAWSARHATLVIADNEAAGRDVARFCGVPDARVRAVPMAPAETFRRTADPAAAAAAAGRWLGAPGPYFLFVGKFSGRRDVPLLLDAFARFRRATGLPHRLALVGLNPHGLEVPARARALGIEDVVRTPGFVPDADLALLYGGATAFVSPSPHETVSLPVLEALAAGAPVLCADTDGMRETTGGAALHVAPMTADPLAGALGRIAEDAGLRDDLARRGRAHVAAFTWRRTAAETLDVLAEAAGARVAAARR